MNQRFYTDKGQVDPFGQRGLVGLNLLSKSRPTSSSELLKLVDDRSGGTYLGF